MMIQADSSTALIQLRAAIEALNSVHKSSFRELRYFTVPPDSLAMTFAALAIMHGLPPAEADSADDYKAPALRILSDPKFIEKMEAMNPADLSEDVITKV